MKKNTISVLILLSTIGLYKSQMRWEDKATIDFRRTQVNKPEVGSLTNYIVADDDADLSTGVVKPKISLLGLKTNYLSDDVSLVYNKGRGIRVNDISSDVGLGWELLAGGEITRKVNGFPDDARIYANASVQNEGTQPIYGPNNQKFTNGWLDYANWVPKMNPAIPYLFPAKAGNNDALGGAVQKFAQDFVNGNNYSGFFRYFYGQPINPDGGASYSGGVAAADLASMAGMGWDFFNVDGEPDEFYFNFGKYSGKFVFDGNRVPTTVPHIPGLKIESPFNSPAAYGDTWIFTTPEGIKYYFSNTPEYYEVLYSQTPTTPFYDDWAYPTPNTNEGIDASEHISKWYLSKVEGVNGEIMEFKYETTADLIYTEKAEIKEKFRPSSGSRNTPPNYFPGSGDAGFDERILPRDVAYRLKSPKRISIIKATDNSKIVFDYDGGIREDIDQSQNSIKRKSLFTITKLDPNNRQVEKIALAQNYFSAGCTGNNCKRLKLVAVNRFGTGGSTLSTTFLDYYTDVELPPRNAYQQDYWGYFNANPLNTLFPMIKNYLGVQYDGADRSPNEERAKANMLKKITYPTKGTIEYEYELNDFAVSPLGLQTITKNKTGGLRIKRISKKENPGATPIVKSFKYLLENGKSSGELSQHMYQNTLMEDNQGGGRMLDRQKIMTNEDSGETSVYMMIYSNQKYFPYNDLIRYSRVVVDTEGRGSTEYLLSAFSKYQDFYRSGKRWKSTGYPASFKPVASSFYTYSDSWNTLNQPTNATTDRSYLRGMILSQKERDSNGNLVTEAINEYTVNPSGFIPKKIYGIGVSSENTFIAESAEIEAIDFLSNFQQGDYVYLKSSIKKDYINNMINISSIENNNYNSKGFLSSITVQTSTNELLDTGYKYAEDKQDQKLINANMVGIPLETTVIKKQNALDVGKIISKLEIKYDNPVNLFPSSAISYNLNNISQASTEVTYNQYDSKGNLLQYTTKDDVSTVIIWGYNKTQPIAKIENAKLENIGQSLIDSIVNASDLDAKQGTDTSDEDLIKALNTFRNNPTLSGYQITTYTYDPLIGVRSITPPSGLREVYIYDTAGRLKEVREQSNTGKLLKEFQYNYKP
ncbi:hypothetical protein [Chryseobacterium jejuense]|uniref:hypothetical protein n=1 Tax=Chryseobacterium jejuense TaxID=445960 RepID=UPI001AE849D8|nr:hypothetical protein [Chryseobacterium jejuense]MBP2619697.1 hypothetical protein [Chryseobacterium jejuense]